MKKLLLWLAVILPVSVYGQAVTITGAVSQSEFKAHKDSVYKALAKLAGGSITPTPEPEPEPTLKPCKRGPSILSVTNISVTYLNAQFDGDDVKKIQWYIRSLDNVKLREGFVSPENNTPGITYNTLAAGRYKLVFTGASCTSTESVFEFTIPGESGGIVIPPAPISSEFGIWLTASEGGAGLWKVGMEGSTSYTVNLNNFKGESLYTGFSQSDELALPDAAMNTITDGLLITVKNAEGKVAQIKRDIKSHKLMEYLMHGVSMPDPDAGNTVKKLDAVVENNMGWIGMVPSLWTFGLDTDAKWDAFGKDKFDHTKTPSSGKFQYDFDELVYRAYKSGKAIKMGIQCTTQWDYFNNGSTRTKFLNDTDVQYQANGQRLVNRDAFELSPGSYTAPGFYKFAEEFTGKILTRYADAFNQGVIMSVGWINTNSGEAEFETGMRGYTNNDETRGDFHPTMVAGFKKVFPKYASLQNWEISNADRNGSQLAADWSWYQAEQMRIFEWRLSDFVSSLPGVTRTQFLQFDMGSATDALSPRRRTFNIFDRVHPTKTIIVKVNDNEGRNKFINQHIKAVSLKAGGCIALNEVSPQQMNWWDASVQDDAKEAVAHGVSISCLNTDPIPSFIAAAQINVKKHAQYQDYRDIQGRTIRLDYPLSQIYKTYGTNALKDQYEAKRIANSGKRIKINIVDDVKP